MPGVALSSILLLVAPPRGFIFSPCPALPCPAPGKPCHLHHHARTTTTNREPRTREACQINTTSKLLVYAIPKQRATWNRVNRWHTFCNEGSTPAQPPRARDDQTQAPEPPRQNRKPEPHAMIQPPKPLPPAMIEARSPRPPCTGDHRTGRNSLIPPYTNL